MRTTLKGVASRARRTRVIRPRGGRAGRHEGGPAAEDIEPQMLIATVTPASATGFDGVRPTCRPPVTLHPREGLDRIPVDGHGVGSG